MARPKKARIIQKKPKIDYFKPRAVPLSKLEEVILSLEELEALRVKDLLGERQEEGAKRMAISRPTFQRVLTSARKKIAEALVKGKAIKMEGGDYQMAARGFGGRPGGGRGRMGGPFAAGPGGRCACTNPKCGHKVPHQRGMPCFQIKCPKCGTAMVREG